MKAQELRIGNWVKSNKDNYTDKEGFITVKNIHLEHLNQWDDYSEQGVPMRGCLNFNFIEPIPFTPEILEKCGFVACGGYNMEGKFLEGYPYVLETEDGKITIDKENTYIYSGLGDEDSYGYCIQYIQYLHQLQNLYFSLTNEELIINL